MVNKNNFYFFIKLTNKPEIHRIILGGCVNAILNILFIKDDKTLMEIFEVLSELSNNFKNLGVYYTVKMVFISLLLSFKREYSLG